MQFSWNLPGLAYKFAVYGGDKMIDFLASNTREYAKVCCVSQECDQFTFVPKENRYQDVAVLKDIVEGQLLRLKTLGRTENGGLVGLTPKDRLLLIIDGDTFEDENDRKARLTGPAGSIERKEWEEIRVRKIGRNLNSNPVIRSLMFNGRHMNIDLIFILPEGVEIRPCFRLQLDGLFLRPDVTNTNKVIKPYADSPGDLKVLQSKFIPAGNGLFLDLQDRD
jgi:hypothetical protein